MARPLSPNAAHGRKFLHPLHHLISRPVDVTIHTFTSHKVQSPLFWVGMIAVLTPTSSSLPLRVVIADIASLGERGIVAYVIVELAYWSLVPAVGYLIMQQQDDDVSTASLVDFVQYCKAPLLVALLLWPNSWIRNGLAVRLAALLGGDEEV